MELKEIKKKVSALQADYRLACEQCVDEEKELNNARRTQQATQEAQKIAQSVAEAIQAQAHQEISSIVSHALQSIFDEPYQFDILFEQKRGKTEASLRLKRGDLILDDPSDQAGGGVIDVASFALRLCSVSLAKPSLRKVLILDEPFRFVSQEYRRNLRDLLQALSEKMGIQIIMVTHIEELQCGSVIRL